MNRLKSLALALAIAVLGVATASAQTKMIVTLPGQVFTSGVGNAGIVTAQTAGVPFNITLTAVNNLNLISTTYTGTKTIIYSGPGGSPTYTTSVTFNNGQATGVATTLVEAQSTTISATDGSLTATASSSLTVKAGNIAKLQLLMPGESAAPGTTTGKTGTPTAQTAGVSFNVTVNAVDANWNVVSTNDTVGITATDPAVVLPANAALVAGTKTFAVTSKTVGSWTVTSTDVTHGTTTASTGAAYAVTPAAASKLVIGTAPSGTAVVGAPFVQQPAIFIEDQFGNLRTSDTLTVTAARLGGSGTLTGTLSIAAVGGVATFTDLAHLLAGTITIQFTSSGLTSVTSGNIVVSAGSFSQLQVLLPGETAAPGTVTGKTGSPTAQTAGTAFNVTVNAVDVGWNVVSANDTVAISSSDANAGLPVNAALVGGAKTFSVTPKTAVAQTFTASDVTNGGITPNTSASVTVNVGAFAKLQLLMPGETAAPGSATGKTGTPTARTAGTAFNVIVNGVDANWNVTPSANGNGATMHLTSSDANATLGADANLSSGTQTFSVTFKTGGNQTVTVTDVDDGAKTANTGSSTVVNAGAFTKLQLLVPGETAAPGTATGKTGTPTAANTDAGYNLTVNAVDANWNLVSTVTDTVGITSIDVNATMPANAALAAGTQTFAFNFNTAGTKTITATDITDGAKTANTSPNITVNAGALAKLQLLMPGETAAAGTATGKTGSPTAQTAGTSFAIIVNSVDANWNVVSTNDTVAITSTDPSAVLPLNTALTAGSKTLSVTNKLEGSRTLTATDVTHGTVTASIGAAYTVNPAVASKLVIATQPSPTAVVGVVFAQQPVILIEDQFGNVRSNDTLTVTATRLGGAGTLAGTTSIAAVGGVAAFTDLNHLLPSTITIQFTSGALTSATSSSVVVSAGPFNQLQVLLPGETAAPGTVTGKTGAPTAQTAGTAFNVTVNAVDAGWNVISTNDTVAISSSDANAVLPANAALVAGTKTFSVTSKTSGAQTVTASDVTNGGIAPNTSASVAVNAGTFVKLQLLMPGETAAPGSATGKTGTPSARTAGTAFNVTVNGVDANWNIVPTASGGSFTMHLTSSDANATLGADANLSSGTQTFSVTFKTAGNQTLTASDSDDGTKTASTSPSTVVNAGAFTKLQLLTPGETAAPGTASGKTGTPTAETAGTAFNVTVNAVDANWNKVVTVADTVGITSSDTTATLPANAALAAGTQTFSVTLNNATGTKTVTATDIIDGTKTANTSPNITVNAGAFAKLQLLMPGETAAAGTATGKTGSPTAQTAGTSFNITVNAVDSGWNVINTNDTVAISSSDANAVLPLNTALAAGTKTLAVTNRTAGVQTLTTTDATHGTVTANQGSAYTVNAAGFAKLLLLAPGETAAPGTGTGKTGTPSNQSTNVQFSVTVNAVDANWNLVTSAPANTIKIISSDANAVLPANAALSSGAVNFNVTLKTIGSRTVTATNVTDGTKTSSTSTINVIGQQPQTITFNALSNQVYGAATFGLSATASSGLTVSFSILSGPATLAGTNLTITGVGTVTVQASQAGNSTYQAATNVNQSFVVTAATLTVSSPNQSRFIGQTNPTFSGTVVGLQYGDSITATFSVTATTNSPIGNYPIIPAFTDAGHKLTNYSVTTNGFLSVNPFATQWTVASGGNGHYYQAILFPGGISWDQASTSATNAGGYLATITSSAENNFLYGLISNTPDYWISDSGGGDGVWFGLIKLPGPLSPTNWTWVTGEAFTYQNWAFGQPNNVNGFQDHAQFYSPSGLTANTWNDAANTLDQAFVPGYIIEYNSNPYASNQTITFGPIANKVYGTAPFSLTATASSGLPVSFAVLSGPATLAGNTLTITGVGTVTIQASQAGDNNNLPAPNVNQSFNVTAAALTITANSTSKTYGQTVTFAGTEFTTSGLVNGDTVASVTLTSSGAAATATVAGSPYTIVPSAATGTGLGNYTITYNNGALTVNRAGLSITANNRSKTYGQTVTFAGTEFSVTGLLNSDSVTSVTLTSSGAAATATVAGSPYSIVPSAAVGTGLGNYTISYNNGSLTVNQASLSITANGRSKTYGQTVTFAGTEFTTSGLVNGDTVSSVTLTSSGAAATALVSGSPYNIVPSAAVGTGLGNYSISYNNGALTINQAALSITANNRSKTYGQTVTFAGTEFTTSGLVNSDTVTSVTLTSSGAAATATVAGSPYNIVPSAAVGSGLANYTISYNNGAFTVNQAALSITANSRSKTYGQTVTFAGTEFTASGLVNSDSVTSVTLTSSGAAATALVSGSPYNIVPSAAVGTGLANYTISYNNGLLTVNPAVLSITANSTSKTYGQTVTFAGTEFTASGLVNSDSVTSVTLTSSGAAATATVAGSPYNIVPSAAVGTGLANYTVSYHNGLLTVNPAALSITANSTSKTYGQTVTFAGTEFTASGLVNSDSVTSVTLTSSGAAATATVAGSPYNIVPSAAVGTGLANYSISYNNGQLTVNRAALAGTVDGKSKTYGDTNPAFTISYLGFVNSEGAGVLTGVPTFNCVDTNSVAVSTNTPVGVYPIHLVTGQSAANYSITYTDGNLTINPAALLATADDKTRAYGLTNPVFTATYTGFVNGEDTNVLSGSPAFSTMADTNSPVGPYPITITQGTLSNANYSFTFSDGTLHVTAFALVINVGSTNRAYGQANPVFSGTIVGLQDGDNITATYGTTANATSPTGTYPITPTLTDAGNKLGNYSVTTNPGVLTVNPAALSITASNTSKTYGQTVTFASTEFSTVGLVNSDSVTSLTLASGGAAATASVAGSPYDIVPSAAVGTGLTNYTISYVNGALTVNLAALSITANSTSKTYGQTVTFAGTEFSVTGLLNTDTATGVTLTSSGAATTAGVTGSPYDIVPSAAVGTGLGNYVISYNNGTLTVNPAGLSITANSTSKTYGQTVTFAGTEFTAVGLLNSDSIANVTLTSAGAAATATVAGSTYAIVPSAVAGTGLANYTISYNNGALTVNPAGLSITANSTSKTYGQTVTFAGTEFTASGLFNSDTVTSVSLASSGAAATATVAGSTYAIVPSAAAGTGLANYTISYNNGALTVNPAALSITANSTSKAYGQTVTFAGTEFTSSGLLNSDTVTSVTLTSSGAVATAPVSGSPYNIVPSAAVGTGLGNYSTSYFNGLLTINLAATSITWTNPADIAYGTALSGVQLNASGSVPGVLTYNPPAGTILNASNAQVLSVTLAPTDPNYAGSSATVLINVLTSGSTNVVTTLTNPALPGTLVTFTSTLSAVAPGSGTPTGTVQFVIDGVPTGAPAMVTNGVAVFSTPSLAHGSHSIAAQYAGDNNFTGSTNSLGQSEIINTPPVTHLFTLAVTENTPGQFSLTKLFATVTDADHDAITLVSMDTNSVNGGSITISNTLVTYMPPPNSTNADSFNYTVRDAFGATASGVVTINISAGTGITENITGINLLPNGHVVIHFAGIPNRTYSVQASTDLQNWSTIGSATAGPNGQFSFEDVNAGNFGQRFYRTAYP